MSLPVVGLFTTPGFVFGIDSSLENSLMFLNGNGMQKRFYLIYGILVAFAACHMLSGALIINNMAELSNSTTFRSADYIRYACDALLIVGAALGVFAMMAYSDRKSFVAFATYAFVLGCIGTAIVVIMDGAAIGTIQSNIDTNKAPTTVDGQRGTWDTSKTRATVATSFGALTLLMGFFAMFLSWAWFQENGSGAVNAPSSSYKSEPAAPREIKVEKPAASSPYVPTVQSNKPMAAKSNDNGWATKRAEPVAAPSKSAASQATKTPAAWGSGGAKEIGGPTLVSKPNPIVSATKPRSESKPPMPRQEGLKGPVVCVSCGVEWPEPIKFCGECGGNVQPTGMNRPGSEWEEVYTDDGELYYYNPTTDESKWPDEF